MSATPLPHTLGSTELSRMAGVHHGRTLLMLGHAAEHLADSHRFVFEERAVVPVDEAIHILMRLSRGVFEEYAEDVSGRCLEEAIRGRGTSVAACH
jgi:hypothetical protein